MSELKDFIEYELKPSIFENVDRLFPEMYFSRCGRDWQSPKKIGGGEPHAPRKDKSIISAKYPGRILEQGGESIDIIEYYQQQRGLSKPIDAIKELSERLGLEMPKGNLPKDYELQKERQNKLLPLVEKMREDIFTINGNKALRYLTEERGYTAEEVKGMGLGYCTEQTAKQLLSLVDDPKRSFISRAEDFVAIPYTCNGEIMGVVFRHTAPQQGENKYYNVFTSNTATKKYNLFGLTPLPLRGECKDIIVVEGELDALRMAYNGFENVVAVASSTLSKEAVEQAKRKGAERIVLLFDYAKTEEEKGEIVKKINKSVETIREVGDITTLVAEFPKEADKVDADTYLKTHTKGELQTIINNSIDAVLYQIEQIAIPYNGRALNSIEQDKFYREIAKYVSALRLINIADYRKAFNMLKEWEESGAINSVLFSTATIEEYCDKLAEEQKQAEQKAKTEELIKTAQELNAKGETAQALEVLKKAKELDQIAEESRLSKYFDPFTNEEIIEDIKSKKKGIPTGYFFTNREGNLIEWELPSGALSFICATPSHGKSRMLQNLAINVAERTNGGEVLFLSLEESRIDILLKLINIKVGKPLNALGNNFKLIQDYFQTGSTQYIKEENKKTLEDAVYDIPGKIRVLSTNENSSLRYIEEIISIIRYANKYNKIKAVFIDYVQLIYSDKKSYDRKGELMNICNSLMDISVATGLPIILGAQMNRETASPFDLDMQKIAEASNIEQSANNILLLWNSGFYAKKDSAYSKQENKERREKLEAEGFTCGEEGSIYCLLDKNRNGERGIYAVLKHERSSGKFEHFE